MHIGQDVVTKGVKEPITYPMSIIEILLLTLFGWFCSRMGADRKLGIPDETIFVTIWKWINKIIFNKESNQETNLGNERLKAFMYEMNGGHCPVEKGNQNINLPMNKRDTLDYPMNWVISRYNLKRMGKNLELVNTRKILN
jgi:hypothetical protein